MEEDVVIKIENLKKEYRLGSIGGNTLSADLQSWWARKRGKEDPNTKIMSSNIALGERFYALDGIDLTIKRGETLGIIGTNGAGKSTLLKVLSRVTAPTEGDVWIKGRISSMLEVGTGFHSELTGRENIYMNGAILGMSKKEVDAKMNDIIEFSECRQFIDTPVKRYSSGMYVKLAFAVAAHLDADIMIMDEVLAVGDMKFQKKCLGKMGESANEAGKTVLYVSHNMATIRQLCNRCVVIKKGKIDFDGDVEEAIQHYVDINKQEAKIFNDYTGSKRTKAATRKVIIFSGKILDRKIPQIVMGEKLKFEISWKTELKKANLYMRVVIKTMEDVNVGIAISEELDYLVGAKNVTVLELDTSVLAPGLYKFVIIIFQADEYGQHIRHEQIDNGFQIEVLEDRKKLLGASWYKPWGNDFLPQIRIL